MALDAGLIDRLGEASLEAKGLIRELHAAVKDARAVLKEIAVERERVETMVKRAVEAEVEEAVSSQLAALGAATQKAMREAVDKVIKEFARLESSIFTGGIKRRDALDLRDLVR